MPVLSKQWRRLSRRQDLEDQDTDSLPVVFPPSDLGVSVVHSAWMTTRALTGVRASATRPVCSATSVVNPTTVRPLTQAVLTVFRSQFSVLSSAAAGRTAGLGTILLQADL